MSQLKLPFKESYQIFIDINAQAKITDLTSALQ